MAPQLNHELAEALRQQGGGPLEVRDESGGEFYIVPKSEYRQLVEHEFRQWLQVGLDEEARGETALWNLDEVLVEARRRFRARQAR